MKLLNIILSERLKVNNISINYTNYGDLYSVVVNGDKVDRDEGTKLVHKLTKLEVPYSYDVQVVDDILNKLSDKGIEADSYEMDID
jgi:hypothetical protein